MKSEFKTNTQFYLYPRDLKDKVYALSLYLYLKSKGVDITRYVGKENESDRLQIIFIPERPKIKDK